MISIQPRFKMDEAAGAAFAPSREELLANAILDLVFRHRNLLPESEVSATAGFHAYRGQHLDKIRHFLRRGLPVKLVLPAFPAKSPNPEKTLGHLPDYGELLALRFLDRLCAEIEALYPPGAELLICSDGRVFSDLVMVSDQRVNEYSAGIRRILGDQELSNLDTYGLEDVFLGASYDEMRVRLVSEFGRELPEIRERVLSCEDQRALFNGIHRFIFEDRMGMGLGPSRNRVREDAKAIAYQVIQRSNAWSELLERHFPMALRLSIHPQAAYSAKIGIRLLRGHDIWGTPWHGVVLSDGKQHRLVKRREAEQLGAVRTSEDGFEFYRI